MPLLEISIIAPISWNSFLKPSKILSRIIFESNFLFSDFDNYLSSMILIFNKKPLWYFNPRMKYLYIIHKINRAN